MTGDIDAFLAQLNDAADVEALQADDGMIDVTARSSVSFGTAPSGIAIRLRPKQPERSLNVRGSEGVTIANLELVGPGVFRFDGFNGAVLSVSLNSHEGTIELYRLITHTMLVNGAGEIRGDINTSVLTVASEANSIPTLRMAPSTVDRLGVIGEVSIDTHISATTADVDGARIRLGDRRSSSLSAELLDGLSVEVVGGSTKVGTLAAGMRVQLSGSAQLIITGSVTDLDAMGKGSVSIGEGASLTDSTIGDTQSDLHLRINERAIVTELKGDLDSLRCDPASQLWGSHSRPFRVRSIHSVTGARLYRLNPFGLSTAQDIEKLREADGLSIWTPPQFQTARSQLDSMPTDPHGRADRLTLLLQVMADKQAESDSLSKIRYLASLARLRSSRRFRREWWLLHAYRLLGFGERIVRLTALYVGAAIVVAAALRFRWPQAATVDGLTADSMPFVELLARCTIMPLSFFRITSQADSATVGPTLIVAGWRVLGVLVLVLLITAIRRITIHPR